MMYICLHILIFCSYMLEWLLCDNVVSFTLTYITFGVVTWKKKNKKIDTSWFVLQHMPSSVL